MPTGLLCRALTSLCSHLIASQRVCGGLRVHEPEWSGWGGPCCYRGFVNLVFGLRSSSLSFPICHYDGNSPSVADLLGGCREMGLSSWHSDLHVGLCEHGDAGWGDATGLTTWPGLPRHLGESQLAPPGGLIPLRHLADPFSLEAQLWCHTSFREPSLTTQPASVSASVLLLHQHSPEP